MPTVSQAFRLNKSQLELDFVNVSLNKDNPLFIDPFAVAQQVDRWSQDAARTIGTFFQRIVDQIRAKEFDSALQLLLNLREPNETRLGYSKGRPQGAGIGSMQARELFEALRDSQAVRTGFITSLEEAELLIPGIGKDKISDLTTNIIRQQLAEYTLQQCVLHGIPHQPVAMPPCFNVDEMRWEEKYLDLPFYKNKPILLVPKLVVRYSPAYSQQKYYDHFMLTFLQEQELALPHSNLVRVLKTSKKRVVHKKDLKKLFPGAKEVLFEFSRKHPDVLKEYRDELRELEKSGEATDLDEGDETILAGALATALRHIQPGDAGASEFHRLMIGIVEFIFYPNLVHPRKEHEIHQGRKRIDIVMENAAHRSFFFNLHAIRHIPCAYVPFECKNYGREVGNPELDQIAGRFSVQRGKVGFLCCRSFEDRALFVQRCRDTFQDDRGLVMPLDDETVLRYLEMIENHDRNLLDRALSDLAAEVTLN